MMNRFQLMRLDLGEIASNSEIRKGDFHMQPAKSKRMRYPTRAVRYWWVGQLLRELAPWPDATVLDIGAEYGNMRRYVAGSVASSAARFSLDRQTWISVDRSVDDGVRTAGYARVVCSDLNDPLPFDPASADVVICNHVMEHLLRPAQAMGEIARILKPGGYLFAGSPTAPKPVSFLLQKWLRRRLRLHRTGPNGHINSFSPGDWRQLVRGARLDLEFLCGTHFLRASGSALENSRGWAKMGLLWGALFPSLGSELCLLARKPITPRR